MSLISESFHSQAATVVNISPPPHRIVPEEGIYFAGSCFAAHLSDYWQNRFLRGRNSLFGNIYNPGSLARAFKLLCSDSLIQREDLFFQQDLWRHSLFDTAKTSDNREELLTDLNSKLDEHRIFLKTCSTLVLTLGTAWVYRETDTGQIVNNCHKRPGRDFSREQLSSEEIRESLETVRNEISGLNSSIKILWTLSPVRHLRDSAEENSLSKALLRCGIDEICRESKDDYYFPAYEIMMDELRDYRWYSEDLSHPSRLAVEYIMKRFCETAGTPELEEYLRDAEKIIKLQTHRVQFPASPRGEAFLEKRRSSAQQFQQKYPFASLRYQDTL